MALTVEAFGVALRLIGYVIGVQLGVVGVAVGISATSIVYWPCRIMVLRSLTGLSPSKYARQFGSAAVGTGLMIVALFLVRSVLSGDVDERSLLSVEVLVGLAAYGVPLVLLDRASERARRAGSVGGNGAKSRGGLGRGIVTQITGTGLFPRERDRRRLLSMPRHY
jgi:hypothetical protein